MQYDFYYKVNKSLQLRYNILTWIPKSLLMQFLRIANIYFLIVSVLTCYDFSPISPLSQISTFAVVLIFTMCKEAYEDWKRYISDKEINNKFTEIFNSNEKKFEIKRWYEIRVGDIIKVLFLH